MGRTAGDARGESRPVLVRTTALVALASVMTAALAVAATLALRAPDAMPRPGAFGVPPGGAALEPLGPIGPPSPAGGEAGVAAPSRRTAVDLSAAAEPGQVGLRAATAHGASARTVAAGRASATPAATPRTAALAGGSNLAARTQEVVEPLGLGRPAAAAASDSQNDSGATQGPDTADAGALQSPVVDGGSSPVVPDPAVPAPPSGPLPSGPLPERSPSERSSSERSSSEGTSSEGTSWEGPPSASSVPEPPESGLDPSESELDPSKCESPVSDVEPDLSECESPASDSELDPSASEPEPSESLPRDAAPAPAPAPALGVARTQEGREGAPAATGSAMLQTGEQSAQDGLAISDTAPPALAAAGAPAGHSGKVHQGAPRSAHVLGPAEDASSHVAGGAAQRSS